MILKRNLIIDVGGTIIRDPMKIQCTITKDSDTDQPDFAEIKLYNLTEGTRSKISTEAKKVLVQGGFGDDEDDIFIGDIQVVTSKHTATEWITTIIAGDGATALQQAIINKSYKSPISSKELLEDIARTSKLVDEDVKDNVEFVDIDDDVNTLRGVSLSAPARDEFTRICRGRGWNWNIQNEKIVVTPKDKSRKELAYDISVETGMVGSPEWVNTGRNLRKKDDKQNPLKIRVEVLMLAGIRPRDKIKITTKSLEGRIGTFLYNKQRKETLDDFFTVDTVKHTLDSRDGKFITKIEATIQEKEEK